MNYIKRLKAYLILGISILLAGCVLSLEPFYTKESKIDMPALNGKWQPVDSVDNPEDIRPWVFDDDIIVTYDEENRTGLLHVTYFKVGGLIYADTTVSGFDLLSKGITWDQSTHYIPGHLVSRIELEGNRLIVRYLNKNWFDDYIQEHPIAKYVEIGAEKYTTLVTNVTPEDWVNFLEKYGADEKAFPADLELIRQVDEENDK